MKAGDTIEVLRDCDPYYHKGDKAVLVERSSADPRDWWADFSGNAEVYGDGFWCAGYANEHFRVVST